jgi:hypothetical protein|tara:strand:+ start:1153 stop:1365 length:213 start_codon:yes stop_codon:yes gene_type:complete
MSGKILDKDRYIKALEAHVTLLSEHTDALNYLVTQIEEDVPRERFTQHLWTAVDYANEILSGPTPSYIDQ